MKNKIIFLLIFTLAFTQNIHPKCVNKSTAKKVQTTISILSLIDKAIQLIPFLANYRPNNVSYTYKDFNFHISPEFQLEIPKKYDPIIFSEHDTHINIHPLTFMNSVLYASMETSEELISIILNGLVKIEKIKKELNIERKELYKYQAPAILLEKFSEFIIIQNLNNAIPKQRIIKKSLKILLITMLSLLSNYIKKEVFPYNLKQLLPKNKTLLIDTLLATFTIELLGEILQRFIITDPEAENRTQEKNKFKRKLQQIISGTTPYQFKSTKKKPKKENLIGCLS